MVCSFPTPPPPYTSASPPLPDINNHPDPQNDASPPNAHRQPPPALTPDQAAALWLAAQAYRALGQRIPLPLPLDVLLLDALTERLSAEELAILQQQLAQLISRLHDEWDGQVYLPTPSPTDPATWRPLIAEALQTQRMLAITYTSAARNQTTQRTIEPYWLEERHGHLYLQAYCFAAQASRLFRLDRISEMALVT